MDCDIDTLLSVKVTSGRPIHKNRQDGTMKREIKRILNRNSLRKQNKHAGLRHIRADLKQRTIYVSRPTLRKVMRKEMGLWPYVARCCQHEGDSRWKLMRCNWIHQN